MTIMRFYDKNEFRIHQSQRIQRNEVRKNINTKRDKKNRYFKLKTAKKRRRIKKKREKN